jgi:hypothetical protein
MPVKRGKSTAMGFESGTIVWYRQRIAMHGESRILFSKSLWALDFVL